MPRDLAALLLLSFPIPTQDPVAAAPEPVIVLEGRVVDMRGEGVPLAKVWVASWQSPEEQLARGVCDGEGFFRIGRVPKRTGLLAMATADGRCRALSGLPREPRPIALTLHDAVTARGTLKNRAGEPVVGAIVRAELHARVLFDTRCDAVTDDEGHFVLSSVPLGPVRFAAVVPGEGVAILEQRVAADVEITLAPDGTPTTTLRIVVEGMPKDSASELTASVLPYSQGSLRRLPPPFDRATFVDGRSEWPLVPDYEYIVRPAANGFAFAPRELRVKPGDGTHELRFVATALGTASLQCPAVLRDAAGKPIAGIALVLRTSNGSATAEATSAEDGTLTFASPLGVGTKVVVYSVDDRWVLDQTKLEGMSGIRDRRFLPEHECEVDPTTTLALRAIPACTVRGRVLLADGRPAAFVTVELEEEALNRTPRWMTFAWSTADREGNFRSARLHVGANRVRIKVEGRLGAAEGEPFDMSQPGSDIDTGELKLAPPATIEGTVLDAAQQPAAGMRVWLRDWDFDLNGQNSGSLVEVLTDRQGRYRFIGVPPGGAWLQMFATGQHPTDRAVEPFLVEAGTTYTHDLQVPAK